MAIQPNMIQGYEKANLHEELINVSERLNSLELDVPPSQSSSLMSVLMHNLAQTHFKTASLTNAPRYGSRYTMVDAFNDDSGLEGNSKMYYEGINKRVKALNERNISPYSNGGSASATPNVNPSALFDANDATSVAFSSASSTIIRDFGKVQHNITKIRVYRPQSINNTWQVIVYISTDGVSYRQVAWRQEGVNGIIPEVTFLFEGSNSLSARYIKVIMNTIGGYAEWVVANSIDIYQTPFADGSVADISNGGTVLLKEGTNVSSGYINALFDKRESSDVVSMSNALQVTRDFGSIIADISRVRMFGKQSTGTATTAELKVEVSDDNVNFTQVVIRSGIASGNAQVIDESLSFSPVSCRYVRLTITNVATAILARLSEIEIFQSNDTLFEVITTPQDTVDSPSYTTLIATYEGDIDFYISNDDGTTWVSIEPDVELPISHLLNGTKMKVRANMTAGSTIKYLALFWR